MCDGVAISYNISAPNKRHRKRKTSVADPRYMNSCKKKKKKIRRSSLFAHYRKKIENIPKIEEASRFSSDLKISYRRASAELAGGTAGVLQRVAASAVVIRPASVAAGRLFAPRECERTRPLSPRKTNTLKIQAKLSPSDYHVIARTHEKSE